MAYTLTNLQDDIRNYTEVGSNVLSNSVLSRLIKNAELKIHRAIDTLELGVVYKNILGFNFLST